MHKLMIKMFDMAVWDNAGKMYLPVWATDYTCIIYYARAKKALAIFNEDLIQCHTVLGDRS